LEQERANFERAALEALSAAVATNGRAATGIEAITEALTERRVQTLLLSPDFQASGGRCPTCGLLSTAREGSCPADGTELLPVPDLREAAVHAALLQDAEVLVVEEPTAELRRGRGIAGLLRF
jgi:peptide subunit release factor 1 (eRF1)